MTKEINNDEKIRALNIIRDFAHDYSINPKEVYPMDQVYKNIIRGHQIKIFRTDLLSSYFDYLKKNNPFYKEFKAISLLVLENIAYLDLKENPALENLRKNYASKVMEKYIYKTGPENVAEQIEKAYYGKILNKPITEAFLVRELFYELFSIKTKSTTEIIENLDEIFEKHFVFERFKDDKALFDQMIKEEKAQDFSNKENLAEYKDEYIDEQFLIGSAEFTGNIFLEDKKEDLNKKLISFKDENALKLQKNDFIEDFYGKSIISEERQASLEKKVCQGIHKDKKLYFTKGDYTEKPNAKFNKKNRGKQREKNKKYIENNLAINNRSINDLVKTIKNAILNYEDEAISQKNYGIINSSKVWRAPVLKDYNVFEKDEYDQNVKLMVDLVLDGSASQIKRQELVANQAYIIAKAMDKADIPIRISSFSSLKDHTVFNVYRDFFHKNQNENIFSYFAAGSNRDGLAFKTLHQIIKSENKEGYKRIIIVLSDGKPHDEKHAINTIRNTVKDQYVDKVAVDDTAKEVRNIKKDGISLLGVFTGQDEDVENAKLIYNKDFCRIKNIDNFSKIVSIFLKNQIAQ
jgi:hypothetical protein